ncbi:proteasome assembly chaperone family protein [Candidatus Bathyarchaeota archaeon]|nr:proteasome assembly chaperone family protein [Candidatus Bathyarchaeota archaeon]
MNVKIILKQKIKFKDPYVICGLPGIGHVGKVTIDYLIRELKAVLFGEVYSHFFPSYVISNKDGLVELMKNELYFWKDKNFKHDLILFTGNTQAVSPEGQFIIAEEVLNTLLTFGVKKLYSIAAYVGDQPVETPRVYGAATDTTLIEEMKGHGVLPMGNGNIGGTNGLIFGLAKTKNLRGICLLGETRGYQTPSGHTVVDVKAARAVLNVLTQMLDIQVDMAPIETQVDQTSDFITKLEEAESLMLRQMQSTSPENFSRYIS